MSLTEFWLGSYRVFGLIISFFYFYDPHAGNLRRDGHRGGACSTKVTVTLSPFSNADRGIFSPEDKSVKGTPSINRMTSSKEAASEDSTGTQVRHEATAFMRFAAVDNRSCIQDSCFFIFRNLTIHARL